MVPGARISEVEDRRHANGHGVHGNRVDPAAIESPTQGLTVREGALDDFVGNQLRLDDSNFVGDFIYRGRQSEFAVGPTRERSRGKHEFCRRTRSRPHFGIDPGTLQDSEPQSRTGKQQCHRKHRTESACSSAHRGSEPLHTAARRGSEPLHKTVATTLGLSGNRLGIVAPRQSYLVEVPLAHRLLPQDKRGVYLPFGPKVASLNNLE